MDVISVKCKSCKTVLKFGADKAGRKTRCKKCGEVVAIPAAEKPAEEKPAEEKPAPPPEPAKPPGDDDEEGGGFYGFVQAPAEEQKKEPEKKKKEERGPARRKLKEKTIQDAELWEKGRVGMIIIVVGLGAWGLALLIQAVIVLLGMLEGPQYSAVLDNVSKMASPAPAGPEGPPVVPTAKGPTLYGITLANQLLKIDPSTGAGVLVGRTAAGLKPIGIAFRGDKLYTWDDSVKRIQELDPASGNTINTIDIGLQIPPGTSLLEGDLAFDGTGVGFLAGQNPSFFSFDLTQTNSKVIGPINPVMDGLVFGGVLWGLPEGGQKLYKIDPATGTTTAVGDTGLPQGANLGGLAFDGRLYAVLSSAGAGGPSILYTLDPNTGLASRVGNIGFSQVCGLSFQAPPPPSGPPGQEQPMPRAPLSFGLLMGADKIDLAKTLYMLIYILNLLQAGAFIGGYIFFTMVPNLNGLRGQAFGLLAVGGANLLLGLGFKLLPAVGAMDYAIVALLAPEVSMVSANIERSVPLQIFWTSGAPFWEISLAILITLTFYAEFVLLCIFLRSMATAIKDDLLQPRTMMLMELSFGVVFIVLAFYVLSICGTSDVLALVLKAVYGLWFGFIVWMAIAIALFLLQARTVLQKYIVASEDEEAEGGKKKTKPKAKDDDEDEDDEDEEEDDEDPDEEDEEDEDEEDRPRRRRSRAKEDDDDD